MPECLMWVREPEKPAPERCSYCHRPLRNLSWFSLPIKGVPTIYACDRWWCRHGIQRFRRTKMLIRWLWALAAANNQN